MPAKPESEPTRPADVVIGIGARYVPDMARQVAALRLLYEAALRRAACEQDDTVVTPRPRA